MRTRRQFVAGAAAMAALGSTGLRGQAAATRLDVSRIDAARIQTAAARALGRSNPVGGGFDGDAFLSMTVDVAALAAANKLEPDANYGAKALAELKAWLVQAGTRLAARGDGIEDVLASDGLAEVAVAIPFLGLSGSDLTGVKAWFVEYLGWLRESKVGLLARDARNHVASAWLLQVTAFARLTGNDASLEEARHWFKTRTLRAQIDGSGLFPGELTTANPFRNSLENLDLLAGVCVLLSTRFDSLWDVELQDGPGMRAAVARFVPYIADPATWPYPADASGFRELPFRRPALLFAARAFAQAEYASLWLRLEAEPAAGELLRAFPIREPLLWQSEPKLRL